jgi:2-keto-4-pentenoate hydratase
MAMANAGQVVMTGSFLGAILCQAATFESLGIHELGGVSGRCEPFPTH